MSHPLVFLHLSDIHFSRRSSTNYDPDLDLRRELVADAVRMKGKVEACSGILVSGDIAFSGKPEEYSKARDWLREICHKLDCSEEAVWVIPGNHDVDREAFRKSSIIQDKHQKLRTGDAARGELEQEMLRLHEDSEAFETLHRAFAGYIKFARDFGCKPEPGQLYWEDDLPLSDGSTLRIRGCNSAIASRGSPPDDENSNRLVVGRQQMLPPHKGPFAGYYFAGSRTLPGFERRCHLARMSSGLTKPDTERTKFSDSQHLLHLRLAQLSPLRHHNILFSDIYGEAFRRAADSADECRKFTILKRADHVAVLIDGEKAVNRQDRQGAFASVDALLGQCLDTGMLGSTSSVQAVITKWDVVAASAPSNATFVDSKLKWLAARHGARLRQLSSFKLAIRPPGGGKIKAGHGMSELLQLWINVRARPGGMAKTSSNGEFHTEFDRLTASWPVGSGGRSYE